ncbi:MAG: hypothetical protein VKL41_07640 [Snowella sp.]|jgi:hypothetical protein|nr:hypothetical protein [Snowella sp.]PZV27512.1 MAG: hypothetical protein DCF12_03635 [Snowella sp.]
MKLQKITWILLAIAVLLGGGLAIYELRQNPQQEAINKKEQKRLFSFAANDIQGISVEKSGQILKFYRGSDAQQTWKMEQPESSEPVEASEAALSFFVNLLIDSQSDRAFTTEAGQLKEYGLEQGFAVITIQLKNGKTHRLLLGNPDFKGDFLYSLVDPAQPPSSTLTITLVSRSFQDLINRDVNEWKKADNNPKPIPEPE